MRSCSYLAALLASLSYAAASSFAALSPSAVQQAVEQAISAGLRGGLGAVGERGMHATATEMQSYAIAYVFSDSDCGSDSMVGALALAANRCIPVVVDVQGTPLASSAMLRCADTFYATVYLGDAATCDTLKAMMVTTVQMSDFGFEVDKCQKEDNGYTMMQCSNGIHSDLWDGPGIGFYESDSCDSDLVSAMFLPESECTRVTDSLSYSCSCDANGDFSYKVFNTSATCTGESTVYGSASETCSDEIQLDFVDGPGKQYFTYDVTLPTCNATNIATFASLSDDDVWPDNGGDGDDDDAAFSQVHASVWAMIASAFIWVRLALF